METDSPVVYHGTSESRFPQKEQQKSGQVHLTEQEIEIFNKCNRESLYRRCLPLAVIGMAATHYASKKGFFSSNSMLGPAGRMTGVAVLSWILGKLSYRSVCEEKFLKLENSYIGDLIRKKRGIDRYKSEGFENEPQVEDLVLRGDSFSYYRDSGFHSSSGSLNLDVDKNVQYSGLDDIERPSTDRDALEIPEEVVPVKTFTTYEELRTKNREEFEKSQREKSYAPRRDQSVGSSALRPWSNVETSSVRRATLDSKEGGSKNIYGDTWDNAKFT